jgi:4-hydroxy-3-polyprenylbenzoate decarboxylase
MTGEGRADILLGLPLLKPFTVIAIYDAGIDLDDDSLLLWKMFNNVDPGRDLHRRGHRIVIDAGRKGIADGHMRQWPDELAFD